MRLIEVTWVDSHAGNEWESVAEAKRLAAESTALSMFTVGYLVDETDDYLLLAATYSASSDGDMVNNTCQIPVCAVTGRRDLHAGVIDHIGG